MLTGRGNAGAAAVGDRIYVFGGFDTPDTGTDLAEVYDRGINQWKPVAKLPEVTTGMGVAVLGGKIYLVGGAASDTSVVRVYDPKTDSYSQVASMAARRELLKATVLDGRLYAIGGVDPDGQTLATVERYNPETNTWENVTPMGSRRGNAGVVVAAGRIFAVGGATGVVGVDSSPQDSGEVFDPQANTWHPLDTVLQVPRAALCAEAGQGNEIIAFGGFEKRDDAFFESDRVESLKVKQH
jgi:N-acetylneuraminic acid mutarotase